ncbi:50S ribosomal protein L6, partial [bacterium]|nr:50S ribosomal protein L6 [bacterium]
MSRIGKQAIEILDGVQVKIEDGFIYVEGPKGKLNEKLVNPDLVKIEITESEEKNKQILVSVKDSENKKLASLWGLQRSLINNMVIGVTTGFKKELEINGVGYKAVLQGKKLVLNVGFSHSVEYNLPEGIEAQVEKNLITISGCDKQLVGQVSAEIRAIKKPEP